MSKRKNLGKRERLARKLELARLYDARLRSAQVSPDPAHMRSVWDNMWIRGKPSRQWQYVGATA
ncbi:MAG: hypothetical protein ACXABY_27040, partial [Candidatus Thorarchaeota archaeon]